MGGFFFGGGGGGGASSNGSLGARSIQLDVGFAFREAVDGPV